MKPKGEAAGETLLYVRYLPSGNRVEVYEVAQDVEVHLINAGGNHYATHFSRTVAEAVDAASRWDGTGHPFAH